MSNNEKVPEKVQKAYVLYATESYAETVQGCVNSIRKVSELPIFVYMLNSSITIDGATSINWNCSIENLPQKNFVNRRDPLLYKVLIERPAIIADALEKYSEKVAYIDADSVVMANIDSIFEMFESGKGYPYFVEGIYDFLHLDGRGGAETREDLTHTLEHEACQLFNVDQMVRLDHPYRQTGYFVADELCVPFLKEWYWMCNHPDVLSDPLRFAPFHEETILNVLLWKKGIFTGLPYMYMNVTFENFHKVHDYQDDTHVEPWLRTPKKGNLLALHGEKNLENMNQMSGWVNKMKILFLAPHLSTGGMPAFLLKRLEALQQFPNVETLVVEFSNYSDDYVVQKNKIKKITTVKTLGGDKFELIRIIKEFQPDIIHVDEMIEGFDSFNQVPVNVIKYMYSPERKWRMIETCHNIVFNPDKEKRYTPDAYAFCSPYHMITFNNMEGIKKVITFPIDDNVPQEKERIEAKVTLGFDRSKKHVLNVGLWTPGKNQAEGLEIARKYPKMHFHFVGNLAVNFREYWQPLMANLPSNVTVWGERNDVDVFMKAADIFMFNSTFECNPLVLHEAISYGLPIVAHNLVQYQGFFDDYIYPMDFDLNMLHRGSYDIPSTNSQSAFGKNHYDLYKQVLSQQIISSEKKSLRIVEHYVDGPYIELLGNSDSEFTVKFYDDAEQLHHEATLKVNHWVRVHRKYFTNWRVTIEEKGKLVYNSKLNLRGKRVYIPIESSALGDTLAWIPYVEEFRKKHDCKVIVSTFKNFLFKDVYPDLEFVEPGTVVNNLYALYRVGCFSDSSKEPQLHNTIPLQKVATNILGLPYEELLPKIAYTEKRRISTFKYVAIATNSTSGCKFWHKREWQKLVNFLLSKGYKVINVSKEKNDLNGVFQIKNTSLENTIHIVAHSEFFIGLSSGLSWLAWAMGKQVAMISNFTEDYYEFQSNCIHITNKSVCHGCWNNPKYTFDPGDWYWCPLHKGTSRQFECMHSITAENVIEAISVVL